MGRASKARRKRKRRQVIAAAVQDKLDLIEAAQRDGERYRGIDARRAAELREMVTAEDAVPDAIWSLGLWFAFRVPSQRVFKVKHEIGVASPGVRTFVPGSLGWAKPPGRPLASREPVFRQLIPGVMFLGAHDADPAGAFQAAAQAMAKTRSRVVVDGIAGRPRAIAGRDMERLRKEHLDRMAPPPEADRRYAAEPEFSTGDAVEVEDARHLLAGVRFTVTSVLPETGEVQLEAAGDMARGFLAAAKAITLPLGDLRAASD